ncbi:glycoside hydrolase family 3 domain protein [Segniliparus rotundus DSM 44985]|uniref:beta-N-acetylhexosaminidase n=1 Tax=Segniliparus rotundus (strain ATCC BAA-972 / CDC 1076 / CIP 108378 / DSM 44985 / JCM 13578) TaxID=640132 RepID=D6ZD66_SEGRD|nr:glycoside hydrolase family 3 N-terminal domain-containing protein [Segniliparus rotundus]ADG99253.1 glycoside hydrolase family 3 domain protein [Segniliparus rotundus DSM 44985]
MPALAHKFHALAASAALAAAALVPLPAHADPAGSCALGGMTTRQKLAQLLMPGVTGAQDMRDVVAREQVGGVFIGSMTSHALLSSGQIGEISASAGAPLLVSIDEEGGRVSRIPDLIGQAPSARTLAQTKTPEQVRAFAADRGRQLRALGVTADFAPDADVFAGDADTVIGDRSFSGDPHTAAEYAEAYAQGLRDGGVLPVVKHFPGHGRASGDSHQGSVTTPDLADLQDFDLVPFREIVGRLGSGTAVMVGHLTVPGLTEPGLPTSLSPATYRLLREGSGYGAAGFDGLVFTDDLSGMKAVSSRYDVPHAVAAALEAGADVALWLSTSQVSAVLDTLEHEVASGAFPIARVEASVGRVLAAKGVRAGTCGVGQARPAAPEEPGHDPELTDEPTEDEDAPAADEAPAEDARPVE